MVTDSHLSRFLSVRTSSLLSDYSDNLLRLLLRNLHSQVSTLHSSKGLSLVSFTLQESVGMCRGSALPLDFVTRILSSKSWMMESDVWADLLIICRWANPTTSYCKKCRKVTDKFTTSCNHEVCGICQCDKWKEELSECTPCTCLQCGKEVVMVAMSTFERGTKSKYHFLNSGCYDNLHCQIVGKSAAEDELPSSKRICSENTSSMFG